MNEHKHTDECLNYAADTGRAFCIASCKDSRVALEAIDSVLKMQEEYADKWADESNWIWLNNLQDEMDELRMTMLGDHEGPIAHELCQIASIAINWLRKPDKLQTSYTRGDGDEKTD